MDQDVPGLGENGGTEAGLDKKWKTDMCEWTSLKYPAAAFNIQIQNLFPFLCKSKST